MPKRTAAARFFLKMVLISALTAAAASAQLERDRPAPPGEPPPPTAFTRLADAGTVKDHPGAQRVIVLDVAVNRVQENGVTYVDLYTLTKILTAEGVRDGSVLEWPYDPRSSFVEVAEVNVVRDGSRIPVDVSRVLDLPAPQAAIYWQDRVKVLQLPRLQVGDGVEVVAMRKGYNYALLADDEAETLPLRDARQTIRAADDDRYVPPMPGEYFDIVVMQADAPIVEKRYSLVLPASKRLISREYNGAVWSGTEYTDSTTTHTWWVENVPALPDEPRQPGEQDLAPKVVLSTAPSWQAKSKWFFDVNRGQFEVTHDIRAHVQQVLAEAGLTERSDPMRVAKALNHWVAQNIRYSGQTMGEGEGFTLHPSNVLFEYRSGVCKDIASMSVTLLRAAGLDAYPAMTMAGSRIEDIPADQFNHCVVAWEKSPGDFVMLDPTWVPFTNDIWSKLENEQQYVIGHPDGAALQEIRYSPPHESPLVVRNRAALREDGTLAGTLRLEAGGALDGRLRGLINGSPKRSLAAGIAALLGRACERVEIGAVQYRRPDDFTGDMWVEIAYELPRYALAVGDGYELRPAALAVVKDHGALFRAGSTDWAPARQTDILLYNTQRLDVREEIRLPRGWRLADQPSCPPVDETLASFAGGVEQKDGSLVITALAEVKRRQIPPDHYAGFRKAIAGLDEFAARPIRLGKGGK